MKFFSSETGIKHVVEVNWADRWQVYRRLQELEIPCCCETDQPLQVEIASPQIVVQLWSVVRQFTDSRQELICTLENCWHLRH